jgi:hypothetical protein
MTLTSKFKKKYIPGFDCRLSTFRNTLATNDIILTNSMTLGLAGTLIFCFNDGKVYSRIPAFVVTGINDQSLEGLAFNLNIYLLKGRMCNMDNAKAQISTYLSMGIPLNIAINRGELQKILRIDTNQINMGHHYVTITEYDQKENKFIIFETDTAKEIQLTESELENIWFYDIKQTRQNIDPLQLCDGTWYSFFSKELSREELIQACYRGINKVLMNFFNSPFEEGYGFPALYNFSKTVHSLRNDFHKIPHINDSIMVMKAMESGMTGGGFGRKLYSYFLSELSGYIKDTELKGISYDFLELSVKWKGFVASFTENEDKNEEYFESLENKIDEIVELEISIMNKLKNWYERKLS